MSLDLEKFFFDYIEDVLMNEPPITFSVRSFVEVIEKNFQHLLNEDYSHEDLEKEVLEQLPVLLDYMRQNYCVAKMLDQPEGEQQELDVEYLFSLGYKPLEHVNFNTRRKNIEQDVDEDDDSDSENDDERNYDDPDEDDEDIPTLESTLTFVLHELSSEGTTVSKELLAFVHTSVISSNDLGNTKVVIPLSYLNRFTEQFLQFILQEFTRLMFMLFNARYNVDYDKQAQALTLSLIPIQIKH